MHVVVPHARCPVCYAHVYTLRLPVYVYVAFADFAFYVMQLICWAAFGLFWLQLQLVIYGCYILHALLIKICGCYAVPVTPRWLVCVTRTPHWLRVGLRFAFAVGYVCTFAFDCVCCVVCVYVYVQLGTLRLRSCCYVYVTRYAFALRFDY